MITRQDVLTALNEPTIKQRANAIMELIESDRAMSETEDTSSSMNKIESMYAETLKREAERQDIEHREVKQRRAYLEKHIWVASICHVMNIILLALILTSLVWT